MLNQSTAITKLFRGYFGDVMSGAVQDRWQYRRMQMLAESLYNTRTPIVRQAAQKLARASRFAKDPEAYRQRFQRTYASKRINENVAADNLNHYTLRLVSKHARDKKVLACHDTTHIIKPYADWQHPAYEHARIVWDNAKKVAAPGYTLGTTAFRISRGQESRTVPLHCEMHIDTLDDKSPSDQNIMTALILKTEKLCRASSITVLHTADSAMDSWRHLEQLRDVNLVFAESGRRKITTPTSQTLYHDELLTRLLAAHRDQLLSLLKDPTYAETALTLHHEGIAFHVTMHGAYKRAKKHGDQQRQWKGYCTIHYGAEYQIPVRRGGVVRQRFAFATRASAWMVEHCENRWRERRVNLRRMGRQQHDDATAEKKTASQERIFRITCTNDFSLPPDEILAARRGRWSVEEMHRTMKWSRDGIGDGFLLRKFQHIHRHLFLCFIILVFLSLLPLLLHASELAISVWGRRRYKTMATRYLTQQHYRWYAFLRWIDKL